MPTIFYSWQSDRPRRITRDIIEDALRTAIIQLNGDVVAAERPDDEALSLDKDTQGVPGSPDISETILKKIDESVAFIADMTPVTTMSGRNGSTKHLPNSNVLIELGYAKKSLSPLRLIQVWNTSFTNCGPEDLPFDMRGRRGPLAFALDESSTKADRESATTRLAQQFVEALKLIVIDKPHSPAATEEWADSDPDDESIWPNEGGEMLLNEPDHGSGTKRVFTPPRSFVRILPARWSGSDDLDRHDLLLEMSGGFSWGATLGGILTYSGSVLFEDTSKVHAITKRFEGTGELWATRTDIAGKFNDHLCIRGDAVPEGWTKYLAYALPHVTKGGGEWPIKVRLGVVGLQGCHWPEQNSRGKPPAALKDKFTYEFVLTRRSTEEVWDAILDAWVKYRRVFTMPHPSMPEQQSLKHFLNSVIGDSLKGPQD